MPNGHVCPLDRGKIVSRTINRAVLDMIAASPQNRLTSTTAENDKIAEALKRTLFGELDELEAKLRTRMIEKYDESRRFFNALRDSVDEEAQKKIDALNAECDKVK